ncbi:metallophosphoesterase family protein [Lacrimispora xylanisolvens]|uniref:metallophosphoesterase family protein n=1 Tax=Lacrimispora xylanisolvens TaxID=384636 RepID=UPI0032E7F52D
MKFFHLSDLHIGKQLNGYSLKENQEAVLNQIVNYAVTEKPDVILICGDIYDKTAPSAEAYTLFGGFLNALSMINPPAFCSDYCRKPRFSGTSFLCRSLSGEAFHSFVGDAAPKSERILKKGGPIRSIRSG